MAGAEVVMHVKGYNGALHALRTYNTNQILDHFWSDLPYTLHVSYKIIGKHFLVFLEGFKHIFRGK